MKINGIYCVIAKEMPTLNTEKRSRAVLVYSNKEIKIARFFLEKSIFTRSTRVGIDTSDIIVIAITRIDHTPDITIVDRNRSITGGLERRNDP
jgi:hypothetical protein